MERQDEVHVDTDEARAGSTPHVVRWILGVGLVLIVVLFTIIVLIGGASEGEIEDDQTFKVQAQDQDQNQRSDIDGIVSGGADEISEAPPADTGEVPPGRVAN